MGELHLIFETGHELIDMRKTIIVGSLIFIGFSVRCMALQVAPSYQMFTGPTEKKVSGRLSVTNDEGEKLTVHVYSKDWFVLPENQGIKAEDWLQPRQRDFKLKAGETKEIQFTINAPAQAQGELVGMISLQTQGQVKSMINRVMSVATYFAVAGTENLKAELEAISVITGTNTVQVDVMLKNVGNVHIRPVGTLQILSEKGEPLVNVVVPQGRPTYPGRTGNYGKSVSGMTLKPGLYMARIALTDSDRKVEILKSEKKIILTQDGKVELVDK